MTNLQLFANLEVIPAYPSYAETGQLNTRTLWPKASMILFPPSSPLTMGLYGLIVATSLAIGALSAFVGLAFVVPVLAHASWISTARWCSE